MYTAGTQWMTAIALARCSRNDRSRRVDSHSSIASTISAVLSPTLRTRIVFETLSLTATTGKTISSGKSRIARGPRANIGTIYCSVLVLHMT